MPPATQLLHTSAQNQVSGTQYLRFSTILGKAWLASYSCRKGEKDEPFPSSPLARAREANPVGWAGLGQKSRSQSSCWRAGLSTPLPARQGSRDGRRMGKIRVEGECIHHKASPSVCKALNTALGQLGQAQNSAPVNDALWSKPRQFTFLSSRFPLYLMRVLGKYMMTVCLQLPSPSLPLSPGSITNKSPRWERGPEETRGTKPQTEPSPCPPAACSPKQLCISLPRPGQPSPSWGEGGEWGPCRVCISGAEITAIRPGQQSCLFVTVSRCPPDPACGTRAGLDHLSSVGVPPCPGSSRHLPASFCPRQPPPLIADPSLCPAPASQRHLDTPWKKPQGFLRALPAGSALPASFAAAQLPPGWEHPAQANTEPLPAPGRVARRSPRSPASAPHSPHLTQPAGDRVGGGGGSSLHPP